MSGGTRPRPGTPGCPSLEDLTAHALGALDPGEERAVAAHVPGCERCRLELERLAPAIGVLSESVEQLEPPPSLREGLMAEVHADAAATEAAPPSRPRRRGLGGLLLRPVTGLAVLALAVAGAVGYELSELGESDAEIVAVHSSLRGAAADLELEGDTATLHAHGLPALPPGAVYQVWVALEEGVVASTNFVPDDRGEAVAAIPEAARASEMMVTREPRRGRAEPTLPTVLDAELERG